MVKKEWKFDTLVVHGSEGADPHTGAVAPPIYQSSTFAFRDSDHGESLLGTGLRRVPSWSAAKGRMRMRQFPSLQLDAEGFRLELAKLDDSRLDEFIAGPFFEELERIDSEAKVPGRRLAPGDASPENALEGESSFRAQTSKLKRLTEALLQEANDRARGYVFQIRWWVKRLEALEQGSLDRMKDLQQLPPAEGEDESHRQTMPQPKTERPLHPGALVDDRVALRPANESLVAGLFRPPVTPGDAYPVSSSPAQMQSAQELRAENEKLRQELLLEQWKLRVYEQENQRTIEDREKVPGLAMQVHDLQSQVAEMANSIRDRLAARVAEIPIVEENEPWALRERLQVLEALLDEMKRQKDQFFEPSLQASRLLIQALKQIGVDTAAFEESLELGNVGAVVIIERVLRELALRHGIHQGNSPEGEA